MRLHLMKTHGRIFTTFCTVSPQNHLFRSMFAPRDLISMLDIFSVHFCQFNIFQLSIDFAGEKCAACHSMGLAGRTHMSSDILARRRI